MRVKVTLREVLKKEPEERGLIQSIARGTGIDRHTIAALLQRKAKSVSFEVIGRLCDHLIQEYGVDPDDLPGALFRKEREEFWDLVSDHERFEFSLAMREDAAWPGGAHVMASDSHLQGVLVSEISSRKRPKVGHAEESNKGRWRHFPRPHLLPAPPLLGAVPSGSEDPLEGARKRADNIRDSFTRRLEPRVLIALGSTKVNALAELMLANTFAGHAFMAEDVDKPEERACPFFIRYRDEDKVMPDRSFCGGMELSRSVPSPQPGIYYETAGGGWECLSWHRELHDVAFVFYFNRPQHSALELACGGFSGRASRCLAAHFRSVAADLWPPQYSGAYSEVGVFFVRFEFSKPERGRQPDYETPRKHTVIPLPAKALDRRLR